MTFYIFPIILYLQLQWAHEVILHDQNKSTNLNKYNIILNFWHKWIIVEQLHESIHYNNLMFIYILKYFLNLKILLTKLGGYHCWECEYIIYYIYCSRKGQYPPLWILRVWLVDMYLFRLPMLLESELVHRKSSVVTSLNYS